MTRFREKVQSMLPKGVAPFLPEATAHKRYVEQTILSVYREWGYREVITPLFEYLDVISAGLGEGLAEKGYKFVDRSNGRIMLLRPDVTPQIAHMVALLMIDRPKPLRLSYQTNVFRHEEEHAGRAREVFQIGGELVGMEGDQADAEVISIAIESLLRLGLVDFKMVLDHSEFFRGFLESLDLPPDVKNQVRLAMARKDMTQLQKITSSSSLTKKQVSALLTIPQLLGGEEVIDLAFKLSAEPRCRSALNHLRKVYRILKLSGWKDYLLLDLSEVRGFDYYTGMVFEAFVKNLGYSVGRGGRYDQLVGKFGKPCPSTGFAFNSDHILLAWQQNFGEKRQMNRSPILGAADILMIDPGGDFERLFQMASSFRKKGLRVIQQSDGMKMKEAIVYARENHIGSIAFLDKRDRVILTSVETGQSESLSKKTFVTRSLRKHRRQSDQTKGER